MTRGSVTKSAVDVNTPSRTAEEGAHSPSWSNRLIIIIISMAGVRGCMFERLVPLKGRLQPKLAKRAYHHHHRHSPSWPNRLVIIISIITDPTKHPHRPGDLAYGPRQPQAQPSVDLDTSTDTNSDAPRDPETNLPEANLLNTNL